MAHPSTFKAAVPFGVASLAIGAAGAVVAIVCAATALKILGVAAAIIGSYAFFATLLCGIENSGDSQKFKAELHKYVGSVVGSAIAGIIREIAVDVLFGLIDKALGRETVHVRLR
ncbi:MAG: hypothetical protein HZB76_03745 [Chlamydiae bacterium]|nr:hypothetical protein [Chlamydiota bacterium]